MQYIYPLKFPKLNSDTHTKIKNSVCSTATFHMKNIKDMFSEYIVQDSYRQSWHNNTNTSDDMGEYCHWLMSQDLNDTIRNDLTDAVYPFSKMDFQFQYMHNGSIIAPHKDSPRNMSFLYMIYQNVGHTHFYKDLTNDPTRVLFDVNDYEGPVQTFQMKQHHWYVMRHDVIHSVSKIDQPRLQIVGGFSKDYRYEDWITQYDHLLDKSFDNFIYYNFYTI